MIMPILFFLLIVLCILLISVFLHRWWGYRSYEDYLKHVRQAEKKTNSNYYVGAWSHPLSPWALILRFTLYRTFIIIFSGIVAYGFYTLALIII